MSSLNKLLRKKNGESNFFWQILNEKLSENCNDEELSSNKRTETREKGGKECVMARQTFIESQKYDDSISHDNDFLIKKQIDCNCHCIESTALQKSNFKAYKPQSQNAIDVQKELHIFGCHNQIPKSKIQIKSQLSDNHKDFNADNSKTRSTKNSKSSFHMYNPWINLEKKTPQRKKGSPNTAELQDGRRHIHKRKALVRISSSRISVKKTREDKKVLYDNFNDFFQSDFRTNSDKTNFFPQLGRISKKYLGMEPNQFTKLNRTQSGEFSENSDTEKFLKKTNICASKNSKEFICKENILKSHVPTVKNGIVDIKRRNNENVFKRKADNFEEHFQESNLPVPENNVTNLSDGSVSSIPCNKYSKNECYCGQDFIKDASVKKNCGIHHCISKPIEQVIKCEKQTSGHEDRKKSKKEYDVNKIICIKNMVVRKINKTSIHSCSCKEKSLDNDHNKSLCSHTNCKYIYPSIQSKNLEKKQSKLFKDRDSKYSNNRVLVTGQYTMDLPLRKENVITSTSQPVELLKREILSNLLQENQHANSNCESTSRKDSDTSEVYYIQHNTPQSSHPLCVCKDNSNCELLNIKNKEKRKECNDISSPRFSKHPLTYPTQFHSFVGTNFITAPRNYVCDSRSCSQTAKPISYKEIKSNSKFSRSHLNNCEQKQLKTIPFHKEYLIHSDNNINSEMSTSTELTEEKECCVRVAVRIRPQNSREKIDLCRICTTVTSGEPQIVLGIDKAFTYDYVFDLGSCQENIYAMCVEKLVDGALNGYNATVLAYGQTGSGKTFTMGTGFERDLHDDQIGIIPRAVGHMFAGIEDLQNSEKEKALPSCGNLQFSVAVQFIELYNEEVIDLLDPYSKDRTFKIHENENREITITGATIKPIHSPQDALKCLQQGALARTTASTKMNDQSSRSHALFTILIRRQRVLPENDFESLTSKFNFVDLAGSERLKRTGATGERAREGISINCGLLALGNCISALGDISKRATHVPYRDSKLTRLLQDSLGGNSQTLMIACVSPSDRDFMETLNTLKYANRARNIKNRIQINQDQSSRTICQLRREIGALQLELLEFKQGKRNADGEGNSTLTDTYHENALLIADNKRLKQRIKSMQETINIVTEKNIQLKIQKETHGWSSILESDQSVTNMIAGYLSEIEKLQTKLIESEEMYQQLKKDSNNAFSPRGICRTNNGYENAEDLITLAKREIEKDRELLMSRSMPEDANNCNNTEVAENEAYESDDSDTESDEKTVEMHFDLNDINSDIEIKTKLIEQLELSQQRMQLMRQHYEDKLDVLTSKILNTQKERDDVLSNMTTKPGNQLNDHAKKVRDEYERKINDMQRELKKLQQAQREHARQQREMQAQEAKLRNLRAELADLKCNKTRLMRKISEQTNRHKEEDTRRVREIAQLRKEQRRQQNTVKSLQAKMQAKDQILKRKTEEVSVLRRNQRGPLSQKAAGRVLRKNDPSTFNSRTARQLWDFIFRSISRAARNKQLLLQLEQELERLMKERDDLSHELANICNRQRVLINPELANEEDTIKSNLNYVQENISLVQQSIMECEEGKEAANNETQSLQNLINNVRCLEEAKFLLDRLTENAVTLTCNSSLTQSRLQEHETLLKEVQQESGIQQQILQHFLAQNNAVKISDLFDSLNLGKSSILSCNNLNSSQMSLHSNDTYDIPPSDGSIINSNAVEINSKSRSTSPAPVVDLSYDKSGKIRRRTAQAQDLLFGESSEINSMTRSYTQQDRNLIPLTRVPSAPGSLKQSVCTPMTTRKNNEINPNSAIQSPKLGRRGVVNKTSPGIDDDNVATPQSPPVFRKMMSREDTITNTNDVFSRLGAGIQDPSPGGSIQKISGKIRVGVPLYCTHTVSGHSNSVLSIKIEDNMLYTAAADRTVKVWDLEREIAQHCLSAHSGPVVAIQNDKTTKLLFSASGPYVRVWDLRTSNAKPIKTLTSSGQVLPTNANISSIAAGESPITAMCLGVSGNLFVAASDKVRIWDLNNLSCVGKLSGGHQAAVMCITSWAGDCNNGTDFVASGSKDHYVKVFEVPKAGGIVNPLLNLEPPHYDGVQALAVAPDAIGADAELFSGSRDSGIKRWDLKNGELKQSFNNAHKGWVSGMAISGDILLSSCRGGVIRLWNIKTCESLAEMKTDLMINDIVATGKRVFTATSAGDVRIWRLVPTESF